MKKWFRDSLVVSGVVSAVACGGSEGDSGGGGTSADATITTATELDAGDGCDAGGVVVRTGVDEDGDGELSGDEISESWNICSGESGMDGEDGAAPLTVVDEADASQCPAGGSVARFGADADGDGELSNSEVQGTALLCAGEPGTDGEDACAPVTRLSQVEPGELCAEGGIRVSSGPDSGTLGGLGGAAGGPSLAKCDGILSPGEETESQVICNGETGETGTTALVKVTNVATSETCAFGGSKIESGLDEDDDGELDAGEVSSTAYVCSAPCPDSSGTSALDGPLYRFDYCWYVSAPGDTCDSLCAELGGENLSTEAESTFPDSCNTATVGPDEPVRYFYENDNVGNWTGLSTATSGHTLGYGYTGNPAYGKCSTGGAAVGTYPGEANGNINRAMICACF